MGTEKKRLDFFFGVLLTENDFIIHCFILLVFPMGCAGWGKHENSRNTMLPSSWPWVSSVSRLMKYYALMSGSMIKECKDPVFQQPGFHEMNVLGGFYCKPVHLNRRQFRIGKSLRYAPIHVSYLWARMETSLLHQHAQHATSACGMRIISIHPYNPPQPLKRQNVGKHNVTWDTLCTNRKKTHVWWIGNVWRVDWEPAVHEFHRSGGFRGKLEDGRLGGGCDDLGFVDNMVIFCFFFHEKSPLNSPFGRIFMIFPKRLTSKSKWLNHIV